MHCCSWTNLYWRFTIQFSILPPRVIPAFMVDWHFDAWRIFSTDTELEGPTSKVLSFRVKTKRLQKTTRSKYLHPVDQSVSIQMQSLTRDSVSGSLAIRVSNLSFQRGLHRMNTAVRHLHNAYNYYTQTRSDTLLGSRFHLSILITPVQSYTGSR